MKVIDQAVTDRYTIAHGDCVDVLRGLPDNSVGLSIYSPPFASLYVYSASPRDMGNVSSHSEFFEQFKYAIAELYRVTMPGRITAFHCMDMPTSKQRDGFIGMTDFPGHCIAAFEAIGWIPHSRATIWKDPVTAMQRTKAIGLLWKQVRKDSALSRQGFADYLIAMRKPGDNPHPITHTGEGDDLTVEQWQQYASPVWAVVDGSTPDGFAVCKADIDQGDTLQHRSARDHEDERHICPLQLPVIRRAVHLWSNPGDVVLSPFAGIGSEGYVALQMGRRFVGAELKRSYYEQAVRNLEAACASPDDRQLSIFDLTA